jgi:hypothetical protein
MGIACAHLGEITAATVSDGLRNMASFVRMAVYHEDPSK